MRAEDVKPGMWVRGVTDPIVRKVGPPRDGGWGVTDEVGDHAGAIYEPSCWEPWVPRVGEWVRRNEEAIDLGLAPDVGTRQVDAVRNRCAAFHGGVRDVSFDWLEPCAPPEARPRESDEQIAARWDLSDPRVAVPMDHPDEADAAIETLRVMLLRTASERAGFARWLGDGPGDATTVGGRACIAIALALLL